VLRFIRAVGSVNGGALPLAGGVGSPFGVLVAVGEEAGEEEDGDEDGDEDDEDEAWEE